MVERSNNKDLSLLSTLYKDIGNDWNLLVSDTKFLLEVESTALLHYMVFIGKEILFPLQFFLTAQNLKLFGQKLLHFSNDAFQSYYDLFQVN